MPITLVDMQHRHTLSLCILLTSILFVPSEMFAVEASRGPVSQDGKVLDENAILLENGYLKLAIAQNTHAGQIMSLVYKPTGHQIAPITGQGFCKDRMGEARFFFHANRQGSEHKGRIVSQSNEKAVAEVSYVWAYDYDNTKTKILVTKTYVLQEDSSTLFVTWGLKNIGDARAMCTPWVKHVGRNEEKLLSGPTLMLRESGPMDPGADFVNPTTDWSARLSGTETTEQFPMVCSVMDYAQIFQQFPWRGKIRFTLETVLSRITLKPGDSWDITLAIALMPNIGNPLYVCPELAAGLARPGALTPGKQHTIKVEISSAMALGSKRIEGEITRLDGSVVGTLPHREVVLKPGKLSELEYQFTPPSDGVYHLVLTVFDNQEIYKLGASVNSQQSSITLPLVVGPKPDRIVNNWQSGGFSWPKRKSREVPAWRSLANGSRLKVAQMRVPERIFPEDTVVHPTEVSPAMARLAGGEYEDIQFVLDFTNEDEVMDLEWEIAEPRSENGATLEKVELREAVYLTTEIPSGYKAYPIGKWPDPLFKAGWEKKIPVAPVTQTNVGEFIRTKRRTFWLVMKSRRNGEAGIFRGEVTLKIKGNVAATIPIEVQVDSFSLPKRAAFRCSTGMVGWKGLRTNLTIMGMSKADIDALLAEKNDMDRYRELILEYGWTPTMWSGPKVWQQYYDFGRGMSVFTGGRGTSEDMAWLKERNLLKYSFIYAPFDEHPDARVPDVVKWCKEWKAKSEIPILDCYYGRNVEPLFDLVDIWLGQSPKQEWAKERKKKGDLFFAVNASLIWYIEFEPANGRTTFWNDFVSGVDGRYVYSTCRWTNDIYKKNWTSGNYMGSAVYPSPYGVATSIRFETMRDGIEDYDYLTILRDAAKVRADDPGKAAAVKDALAVLTDESLSNTVGSTEALHEVRAKVAELITELQK